MPMFTNRPPLILRVIGPLTTSPSLCFSRKTSHSRCRGPAIAEDDGSRIVLEGFEEKLNFVAGARRDDLPGSIVVPLA